MNNSVECHTSVNDQEFARHPLRDDTGAQWAKWCVSRQYVSVPNNWLNKNTAFASLWGQLLCSLGQHAPSMIKEGMLLCAHHLPETKVAPAMFASVLKRRLEHVYGFNNTVIDDVLIKFLVGNDSVGSRKLKFWLGIDFLQECLLCTYPRFDVITNIVSSFEEDQQELIEACLRHIWMGVKWCEQVDIPLNTPQIKILFAMISDHVIFEDFISCIKSPDITMEYDHPHLYQHTPMFIDYVKECTVLDLVYNAWPHHKLSDDNHQHMQSLFDMLGKSGTHMPHTKSIIEHQILSDATDSQGEGRSKKKM